MTCYEWMPVQWSVTFKNLNKCSVYDFHATVILHKAPLKTNRIIHASRRAAHEGAVAMRMFGLGLLPVVGF